MQELKTSLLPDPHQSQVNLMAGRHYRWPRARTPGHYVTSFHGSFLVFLLGSSSLCVTLTFCSLGPERERALWMLINSPAFIPVLYKDGFASLK